MKIWLRVWFAGYQPCNNELKLVLGMEYFECIRALAVVYVMYVMEWLYWPLYKYVCTMAGWNHFHAEVSKSSIQRY